MGLYESRTRRGPDELAKVSWHRRVVMCHEDAAVAAGNRQHLRILEASEASSSRGSEVDFGIATKDGADDDLVEVSVRLETDRHSANDRDLLLRVGQLLIEHRVSIPRRLARRLEILPPRFQVAVDIIPMSEIERDGTVDLLEGQIWKGLRNAFCRLAG